MPKNLSEFEYKVVDGAVTECLSSKKFQEAIQAAIQASVSGASQKVQGDIQRIAEECCNGFRTDLKKSIAAFCDDWMSKTGNFEVVPRNTRLLKSVGNYRICVVEQEPCVRTLSWSHGRDGGGDGTYRLALPYVVFIVYVDARGTLGGIHVAFADQPLTSLKSNIYGAALPNLNEDLSVCTGDMIQKRHNKVSSGRQGNRGAANAEWTLCEVVEEVIAGFWGSTFNNDLNTNFQKMNGDPRLASPQAWEEASAQDPLFVLGVKWKGRRRLEQQLNKITNDEVRMQFAPIIDGAVVNASTRLNQYLLDFATQGIAVSGNRRAVGQFRSRLYDFMYQAAQSVCEDVKRQYQKDYDTKLARELEKKSRSKTPQKRTYTDDYLYRAPEEATW